MDKETWEVIKAIQEKQKETLDTDISIYENFRAMYFFDGARLQEIINSTNGAKINSKLEDIEFMIQRMGKIIQKIEQAGNYYLEIKNESLVDDFIEYCYLYSAYAETIYHIYKYLEEKFAIKNDINQRNIILGDEGLGEENIVQKIIRNSSLHGKLYKPSSNVYFTFQPYSKRIEITLLKEAILSNKNCNGKGKQYLEKHDRNINIVELFNSYLQKVKNFFEWYRATVYIQYNEELKLYDDYVSQLKALQQESINGLKKQRENQ